MFGDLWFGLVWKGAKADQCTIGAQPGIVRTNQRLNRDRPRLTSVELKRRKEVYIFNCFDMPAGQHAQSGFGEGLNPHYTGKHGRAVNLMVVQEWLNRWIKHGVNAEALVNSHACDFRDHRPRCRQTFLIICL